MKPCLLFNALAFLVISANSVPIPSVGSVIGNNLGGLATAGAVVAGAVIVRKPAKMLAGAILAHNNGETIRVKAVNEQAARLARLARTPDSKIPKHGDATFQGFLNDAQPGPLQVVQTKSPSSLVFDVVQADTTPKAVYY